MSDIKLTKDADAMICVLYKKYLQRRKDGASKCEAKLFSGSEEIHDDLMPKWSFEDVDETCRELSRAGLLDCLFAEDVTEIASLSDAAIIYMENRFKDNVSSLLAHIDSLLSLIPWV